MTIGPDGPASDVPVYPRWLPRFLDITERAVIVFTFIFYFAANLASMNPLNIIVGLTDSVAVFCILLRRPSDSVSLSPLDWTVAIIGTMGPMLARPGGEALSGVVGPGAFWLTGLVISIAAKLSLNRRFGLAPANRGVQVRGAYAFVRHPMYAGYALMNAAYLLVNPTAFNLSVFAVAWGCQLARINREESWLKQDAAYRAYAKTVRFRVIPFVI